MSATRLEIRLKQDAKELIVQAAELRNQSISQFVLDTLSEEASKVVEAHQKTVLSDRDRDAFMKLLDNPPGPNNALRNAAKQYRKRIAK